MTTETTTTEDRLIPDDSARLTREMVAKLTAAVEREPTEFNVKALRGWLHELAHPTRYKGEDDAEL